MKLKTNIGEVIMSETAKFFGGTEREQLMYAQLKLLGVSVISIDFSGGGDDGQLNEVTLLDAQLKPLSEEVHQTKVMAYQPKGTYVDGNWVESGVDVMLPIICALEPVAYAALNECGLDWCNNDGGQGELTIDLREIPPTVRLQIGINCMQTEEHEFTFGTDND